MFVFLTGFSTKTPDNFKEVPNFNNSNSTIDNPPENIHLYVPNITKEHDVQPFRRVAIVEEFFDIIYNVHVGLGGRSGRHAGQKRTYRTITETYAFLPRDAVTHFLAGCRICNSNKTAATNSPSSFTQVNCGDDIKQPAWTEIAQRTSRETSTDSATSAEHVTESQTQLDSVRQELNNYYQLLRVIFGQSISPHTTTERLCSITESMINDKVKTNCSADINHYSTSTPSIASKAMATEHGDTSNSLSQRFNEIQSQAVCERNNNFFRLCSKTDVDIAFMQQTQVDVEKNEFGKCVELRTTKEVRVKFVLPNHFVFLELIVSIGP